MSAIKLASIAGANFFAPATSVFVYQPLGSSALATIPDEQDCGDITANVWKQVASVSGSGFVRFAATRQNSTASQQISTRLVIDGSVVCTRTRTASASATTCVALAGTGVPPTHSFHSVPFSTSAALEVTSSIGRTAGSSMLYSFITTASSGLVYSDPLFSKISARQVSPGLGASEVVHVSMSANMCATSAGALTAGVYSTVIDITAASGVISAAYLRHNTSSSCNCSMRVTLDGVVVAEGTSTTASNSSQGMVLFGGVAAAAANGSAGSALLFFRNSLRVEVASSINRVGTSVSYEVMGYLT